MKRFVLTLALVGCTNCDGPYESTPVGERCYIGAESKQVGQAIIAAPALECSTRTCLHMPGDGAESGDTEHADMCTAPCSSDDDCSGVEGSPCAGGFACAIPVVEGPFACQSQCVCADYLPDDSPEVPEQCVAL